MSRIEKFFLADGILFTAGGLEAEIKHDPLWYAWLMALLALEALITFVFVQSPPKER